MVKIRQEKVDKIAEYIPEQTIDNGPAKVKVLVLGWGSTYGAIKSAVAELVKRSFGGARAPALCAAFPAQPQSHSPKLRYRPYPGDQQWSAVKIIRDVYFVDARATIKIMGVPIQDRTGRRDHRKVLIKGRQPAPFSSVSSCLIFFQTGIFQAISLLIVESGSLSCIRA